MSTEETEDDNVEYIEANELTIGLESDLLDILITEDDMRDSPVINAEGDARSGVVSVHLPFRFNWDLSDDEEDIAFSENFVHTELDPDRARELIDQLEEAVDEIEGEE